MGGASNMGVTDPRTIKSSASGPEEEQSKSLVHALAVDSLAAVSASFLVAPFVVCIDRAIAESVSGKDPLWTSFGRSARTMVTSPVTFARQPAFGYLWALFGGTYLAANLFRSYEERTQDSLPIAKTGVIFTVNTSLALWKDAAFAKMFSTKAPAPMPYSALSAWWARDVIMMGCIFVAPPIMGKMMHEKYGMDERRAETVAQVSVPLLIAPIVAPPHLLGYILYNQPSSTWPERLAVIRKELWGTVIMRCFRAVPPYCIGTVVNTWVRRQI